jgi:3-mercaptopyruvate sulfurtransferase SseA
MKRLPLIVGAIAVVALVAFALLRNQKPKETPAPAPVSKAPDEMALVPRTALATARQEIESGAVVLIDVRDADAYVASHIPGALQIPLMRIEGEINYLPRDKPILTYCT